MDDIWIGSDYDQHRLLLLGESTYSWLNEDGDVIDPAEDHDVGMVEAVLHGQAPSRFMTMLNCGLTGSHRPTAEQAKASWAKVAFTNYVRGTVGLGSRKRPLPQQWVDAADPFKKLLLERSPRNIIVLGKTLWKNMPEADLYLTEDVQGYALGGDNVAMCWALTHPAGGLSWRRLAQVIAFADRREILRL